MGIAFAGGLRALIKVRPQFTERYYAIFCGGIYIETIYCDEKGTLLVAIPPGLDPTSMSFYIEDVGQHAGFNTDDIRYISMHAKANDALTAQRLGFVWDVIGKYQTGDIYGTTQITNLTIEGAHKNINVQPVPNFIARGRLNFSITNVGAENIIRWYNDDYLVAEGYVEGNGAFECTEIRDSGLTITGTLTYTADINREDAYVELLWPETFDFHFSTSPLSFPREPEFTVIDEGREEYEITTGPLPATAGDDVYYWNIVPRLDNGVELSSPSSTDNKTIRYVPAAPTITSVTKGEIEVGNASNGFNSGSTSIGVSHTVAAGDDRVLLVALHYTGTLTGISYGAQTGFFVASNNTQGSYTTSLVYLVAPNVGTANIVATFNINSDCALAAVNLTNVDQTTPLVAESPATDTGATFVEAAEPAHGDGDLCVFVGSAYNASNDYSLTVDPSSSLLSGYDHPSLTNNVLIGRRNYTDTPTDVGVLTSGASDITLLRCNLNSATAGGYKVTFTNGEAGCTYKGYTNGKNRAINFGDMADGPAPVGPTALNATSLIIPAFSDVTEDDYTSDYTTVETAIDGAIDQIKTSFTLDQLSYSFITTLEVQGQVILDAMGVYAAALGLPLREKTEAFNQQLEAFITQTTNFLDWGNAADPESGITGFMTANFVPGEAWLNEIGLLLGQFQRYVSVMLCDDAKRYTLPNGALPGSNQGAESRGLTEDSFDDNGGKTGSSLWDLGQPFVRPATFRIVVRATKYGNESQNGNFYELEVDEDGELVGKRPNTPSIKDVDYDRVDDDPIIPFNGNASNAYTVTASTVGVSWTHTVQAGENRYLLIALFIRGTSANPTIRVDGVATAGGTFLNTGNDYIYLRHIDMPAVGTVTITTSFNTNQSCVMHGLSLQANNCRQGNNPFYADDGTATNTNTLAAPEPPPRYDSADYYARGACVGVYMTKDNASHLETVDPVATLVNNFGSNDGGTFWWRFGMFFYYPPRDATFALGSNQASTNYLGVAIDGLTPAINFDITVQGQYIANDELIAPAFFDAYVVPVASTIDPDDPDESVAIGTGMRNYYDFEFDPIRVGSPGHYRVGVAARSADGVRSQIYEEIQYIHDGEPVEINKKAFTIRSRGQ